MRLPPSVFDRRVYGVKFFQGRPRRGRGARRPAGDHLFVRYGPPLPEPAAPAPWHELLGNADPPSYRGLYPLDDGFMLRVRCQGRGSFVFSGDELLIAWEPAGTGPAYYLFGLGLALWLERRGVPCLHANALADRGRSFGLIGDTKTGKTTLTVALLQRGFSLLSDDLLTLAPRREGFWATPGLPQVRMWPDAIAALLPALPVASLERVHARFEKRWIPAERIRPGAMARAARPVTALYLLECDDSESCRDIVLEPMRPGDALVSLLTSSVIGDAAAALGLEARRLACLARVVETVRVRRLRYPDGPEWLARVCDVIAGDLRSPQARSSRTACASSPVPYR